MDVVLFFFSSRRRHTRWPRDWSSDVCSSDLIGVKLARPDNQVVCLQGDGGFLFGQSEALWTMSRYDVPIIVVIFNNRCYNETRARMYAQGGRQSELRKDMLSYLGDPNVDFVSIAGAYNIK